jgi:hypothetical protein
MVKIPAHATRRGPRLCPELRGKMIQPFFRRRGMDFIGTRRADEPLLPECRCPPIRKLAEPSSGLGILRQGVDGRHLVWLHPVGRWIRQNLEASHLDLYVIDERRFFWPAASSPFSGSSAAPVFPSDRGRRR